jgi:RNA polymerase sigma-70 factor (ECF subfamily)
LTQAFFADVLRSNKLAVADQARGRFRWFLMTSCKNFASNVHRHQNSLRRGGSQAHVSLDVDMESGMRHYDSLDSQQWTPEQIFDRRWALQLIQLATQRVRDEYEARGQADWFDHLEPFIAPASDPPSHAGVAEQLEVSVGAVKTAIHRLRKRFGVALQEEVSETVNHRDDVKDELRILMEALSGL